MSEHRKLTEHDEETGEPYDVCPACVADWPCVYAERDALQGQNREFRSLLECTEFALEWLILHHVIEDGGADWKSKFDGSAFFACDCAEDGGYMEYDTNAYIHTERCASGFEDSLGALLDQTRQALTRRPTSAGAEEATDG